MSSTLVTHPQLAVITAHATPNLFGAIEVEKPITLRKSSVEEASEVISGTLYKRYTINGFATLKDYETAVNNSKERQGQEREFTVQERKWGEHWNGSPLVITHNGRFYLQVRLTKNTVSKSVFVDEAGVEHDYESIESFLLAKDKRETKRKSIEATAEHQGLTVEESVQIRDIPFDTIKRLAYGGTVYEVIPQTVGEITAELERMQDEDEPRQP